MKIMRPTNVRASVGSRASGSSASPTVRVPPFFSAGGLLAEVAAVTATSAMPPIARRRSALRARAAVMCSSACSGLGLRPRHEPRAYQNGYNQRAIGSTAWYRRRAMARTEEDAALVDRLAATIQARVLSGEFASGSRLRQESLAAEFGVSRTPVREALRKLQAAGIVQLEPRRGARVRGPSAREVREAYEVRAELEGLAAALAAERIRDEELRRLHQAQALFEESSGRLRTWKDGGGGSPPPLAHAEWI